MGTYNLPRNVKGEGRILFIFSNKALIYTFCGIVIGFPVYFIMSLIKLHIIGVFIMLIFGVLGFCAGTFKVPDTNAFEITRKTGGENIDDVIKRWFKFNRNKNRIYIYKTIEKNDNINGGKKDE